MSTEAMNWVWQHSQAAGTARLVMLALADHADENWSCYPGLELLATKCRVSERTVERGLDELVDLGELRIDLHCGGSPHRRFKSPRHRPNRYVMVGRQSVDPPPEWVDRPGASGSTDSPEWVDISGKSGSTLLSTEPSLEPSVGPSVEPERGAQSEKRARSPRKRGSPLPQDFTISEDLRAWALKSTPTVDADCETEKFVDYWRAEAGPGRFKLDWDAAWRTWMRRAVEWSRTGSRNGSGALSKQDQELAAALEPFLRDEKL